MRYVATFVAFILFIIVGIFGYRLISNQLKSFDNNDKAVAQVELNELKKQGVKLRFTIKGPVVADENYRELVFEIGQGSRSLKLYKGYNQTLVKEQALSNNYNSYEVFAGALHGVGFITERTNVSKTKYENECPFGNKYFAELIDQKNRPTKTLWRVSCDSRIGTMGASPTSILDLYKKQFPEYKTFSSDISID
jgi:hypothetical protein